MKCTSPEVFPGKHILNPSLKLVVEHSCWPHRYELEKQLKRRENQKQQIPGVYGHVKICGSLKRLRYAVGGGLIGHLLSRLPQLLPCCATVVNTDSDRHMVKWNLSLHRSNVMWRPFRHAVLRILYGQELLFLVFLVDMYLKLLFSVWITLFVLNQENK